MDTDSTSKKKAKSKLVEALEDIFAPRHLKDPRNESFWDMVYINLFPHLKLFSFAIFCSLALLLIFFIQIFTSGINIYGKFLAIQHIGLTEILLLEKSLYIYVKDFYRIFTCTFIHDSMPDLSNTIVLLLIWGSSLEYSLGLFRTLIIFILSSFTSNLFGLYYSKILEETLLGADGAVFGVLGAGLGYIIYNWNRIHSRTSSKLQLFWMVSFIITFGFIFSPSAKDTMKQMGGCFTGMFLGMFLSPLEGAKTNIPLEEQKLYQNIIMVIGILGYFLINIFGYYLNSQIMIQ